MTTLLAVGWSIDVTPASLWLTHLGGVLGALAVAALTWRLGEEVTRERLRGRNAAPGLH